MHRAVNEYPEFREFLDFLLFLYLFFYNRSDMTTRSCTFLLTQVKKYSVHDWSDKVLPGGVQLLAIAMCAAKETTEEF